MLAVGDIVERGPQLRLVGLEVFRRVLDEHAVAGLQDERRQLGEEQRFATLHAVDAHPAVRLGEYLGQRSEEHTSELQSLMRISYAVFCLKKKNKHTIKHAYNTQNCDERTKESINK